MDTYLIPWKKYATFSGRAPRKEFWTFYLVNTLVFVGLSVAMGTGLSSGRGLMSVHVVTVGTPALAFGLAVFLPTVAVIVRRLHDIGRSGFWVLMGFVPVIGGIVVLILMLMDTQPETNQYGPNPKLVQTSTA